MHARGSGVVNLLTVGTRYDPDNVS
jgi:hypothetical protein